MGGEAVGFETEATAIMDTMAYIRPDIYTLVRGGLAGVGGRAGGRRWGLRGLSVGTEGGGGGAWGGL